MRLKLSLFFVFISIYSWSQTTNTFTTGGSFVVAAGLTQINTECWGAGGSGGGNNTGTSAGGGGGGGYTKTLLTVIPNSTIPYTVGIGGTGTTLNGTAGTASFFSTVTANGGGGGTSGTGLAAGVGGAGGSGTYAGGKGANGSIVVGLLYAGGGGSSAGTAANGNDGYGLGAGGLAVAGGGAGGAGGALNGSGAVGAVPGGGGGGAVVLLGNKNLGGNGGNGQIRITYTCPSYSITATTASNACVTAGTSLIQLTSTAALLPQGNYTVAYTINNPAISGSTAMTVNATGSGSFSVSGLTTVGTSIITINTLTSGTCSSTITAGNTANIVVSAASAGGTVAGGTTICSGSTSSTLTLSGQTGTVVKWQSSVSPFSTWTDIASTANITNYTSGALTQTTQFRAVVQNGPCIAANSTPTTVAVTALPTAPAVSAIQPSCQNNSGTITVTSPASGTGFTYSRDGVDFTNTTGVFTGLVPGPYNIKVRNTATGCVSPATAITINPLVSKVWNGSVDSSWANPANWTPSGPPLASDCVDIPNVPNPPIISGTNGTFFANRLTIQNNGSLTVQGTNTITVTNEVTVLGNGLFTFENNSSLVQVSNAVNVGNIVYKRNTQPVRRYDATHWSSPVSRVPAFTLHDLTPTTLLDKYFKYTPGVGWETILNGTEEMEKGRGYSIRSPQPFDINNPQIFPGQFTGVPNNGDILGPPVVIEKYSLLGNPYPSAIYADRFIYDNQANIYGTIYIWTHNTPPQQNSSGDGMYYYSSNDYAIYNLSGSVVIGGMVGTPSPNPGNQSAPLGYIAAGQGFFVKAKTNQRALFTNSMREPGNNSQFYKSNAANDIERHRVWLNLYNSQGAFKQLLIGYATGATNFIDNNFDAISLDAHPIIDFYSVIDGKKLVIQGRALPFAVSDTIQLGYRSALDGDFTIAIDHRDGNLSNQTIYLQDNETKKVHNLSAANYTFRTGIGVFQKRFVLRYTDSNDTLGNEDFASLDRNISVSVKDKTIKLQSFSETENLEETSIYDSSGKLLYNKKGIDNKEWFINNLKSGPQVLLVKITLDNGKTVTRKIIFN